MNPTLPDLIAAAHEGAAASPDELEDRFVALYEELHRLARRELSRKSAGRLLGATSLLHDAYLELIGRVGDVAFPDQGHFMGYAAKVMRGLIIDQIRNRQTQKRGALFQFISGFTDAIGAAGGHADFARVPDALDELEQAEPILAEVVDLKFFCGFSFVEIAGMRGVSERTVQRQWDKARIFLYRSLSASPHAPR